MQPDQSILFHKYVPACHQDPAQHVIRVFILAIQTEMESKIFRRQRYLHLCEFRPDCGMFENVNNQHEKYIYHIVSRRVREPIGNREHILTRCYICNVSTRPRLQNSTLEVTVSTYNWPADNTVFL